MCVCVCVRMHTCVLGRGGLGKVCPADSIPPSLPLSMEVGVCVEAYRQEAETHRRHINSAFMTFVVLGADDQPQMLPWIRPQPGVSALLAAPFPLCPGVAGLGSTDPALSFCWGTAWP